MEAPVSRLVGIGQRRALDFVPEAHVVKLGGLCRQTDLDVVQALAVGQLCKGQYAELIGTCHRLDVAISVVAIDDAVKSLGSVGAPRWFYPTACLSNISGVNCPVQRSIKRCHPK